MTWAKPKNKLITWLGWSIWGGRTVCSGKEQDSKNEKTTFAFYDGSKMVFSGSKRWVIQPIPKLLWQAWYNRHLMTWWGQRVALYIMWKLHWLAQVVELSITWVRHVWPGSKDRRVYLVNQGGLQRTFSIQIYAYHRRYCDTTMRIRGYDLKCWRQADWNWFGNPDLGSWSRSRYIHLRYIQYQRKPHWTSQDHRWWSDQIMCSEAGMIG